MIRTIQKDGQILDMEEEMKNYKRQFGIQHHIY